MLNILRTKNVKLPTRSGVNAGFDFYVPNDQKYILSPNKSINIKSGIKVRLPENYCMIAFNKSGIASKYNLIVGACVIDENYTGEIHLNLFNIGNHEVNIEPGMKLIQFILIKQTYHEICECKTEDSLYNNFKHKKERGESGFGSTGIY